jgi:hypothetical protein
MTGAEVVGVAVSAAAFGVGWAAGRSRLASGRRRREDAELRALLRACEMTLDRAVRAHRASDNLAHSKTAGQGPVAAQTSRAMLGDALSQLGELRADLTERVGADHPLAEDLEQAASALALLADSDASTDRDERIGPLEQSVADARLRFDRTYRALALLDPAARPGRTAHSRDRGARARESS